MSDDIQSWVDYKDQNSNKTAEGTRSVRPLDIVAPTPRGSLSNSLGACTWTYSGDDYSTWDTTCGRMFCMTEDTPKRNDYNFCPGCGGTLIEVMPVESPLDDDSENDGSGVKNDQ